MNKSGFDFDSFDRQWLQLGREICQAIYTQKNMQKLKHSLQKKGYLSLDEKSEFINICNQIKYQVIYDKYGQPDSEGYKEFSDSWQNWFEVKGVESQKGRIQRSSVDHILFGSTPDPEPFLLHFEEEMLGSMEKK